MKNTLCEVSGLLVGHYTDLEAVSGTTVVICPEGAVAGVDVRGAAPGTRETDLLDPVNLVEKVQAICLSGGSVYGLSAADGVVNYLAEKGWGFDLGMMVAPIVPAAILFDLGRGPAGRPKVNADWGYQAAAAATTDPPAMGTVGAGTGALAGGIKGGLGTASEVLAMGITVGALVAVNSLGSVIDPVSGRPWELRLQVGDEFGPAVLREVDPPPPIIPVPGAQTTIGLVATDARLTKAEATKVAQMAQDGLARAIRPAHTMFDGDTIFALATGKKDLPEMPGMASAPTAPALTELGRAAADCMTRAIIRGVALASSLAGMTALEDWPVRQQT